MTMLKARDNCSCDLPFLLQIKPVILDSRCNCRRMGFLSVPSVFLRCLSRAHGIMMGTFQAELLL